MELLIVVAIILIIATIAIPSLLRSRQSANESGGRCQHAQPEYRGGHLLLDALAAPTATFRISSRRACWMIDMRNAEFQWLQVHRGAVIRSAGTTRHTRPDVSPNTSRYDYYCAPDFVIRYTTAATRAPAG